MAGPVTQRLHGSRDERGGVIVMFVVFLPVLLLFVTFVIDVGNWFEHKRHLQLQADAAALAGGGKFAFPCSDSAIEAEARNYAGASASTPGARWNTQIGGTQSGNVHALLNAADFWNDGGSDHSAGGGPCGLGYLDVKMTESNLPWLLQVAQVPAINAHARVSFNQIDTQSGALPVGVQDVNPKSGQVVLIDEDACLDLANPSSCAVVAAAPLVKSGACPAPNAALQCWDTSAAPITPVSNPSFTVKRNLGVVVVLSGAAALPGSYPAACTKILVTCYETRYDNQGAPLPSTKGLLDIRGYTALTVPTAGQAPRVGSVSLFNTSGTCPDPYFVSAVASCTLDVSAAVAFNGPKNTVGAKVWANVNGTDYPLACATPTTATCIWTSAGAIPVAPQSGRRDVFLKWEQTGGSVAGNTCKNGNGNKCTGSWNADGTASKITTGNVGDPLQRVYGATTGGSGPVKFVRIADNGATWANSLEFGTTAHSLVVQVAIAGSLANAAAVSDPPVYLRVAGDVNTNGNQSQNQSLDCDPASSQLSDEIAAGCKPSYTKNGGTACPASASSLWGTSQPWSCVAIQTGQATNQVAKGLNTRILGNDKPSSCTSPNHWSSFPALPEGDPRVVHVFLTPFGTFNGSGSGTVPISDFGTFYVTGWTGQGGGFNNPCQGNGDDPVPNNDAGVIVGHFIKYIDHINTGGGSTTCDLSAFGACVVQLTD